MIKRKNGSSIDDRGKAGARFKSAILAQLAVVTIAVAAVIPLAGTGAAHAATPPAPGYSISMHFTSAAPVAQSPRTVGQAPPAPCPIAGNTFNRTQLCFQDKAVLVITRGVVPVGGGLWTVTHYLHLTAKGNTKGSDYSEEVRISGVKLWGEADGAEISLVDNCGRSCTAVGNTFPSGAILRSGLHGTLTFRDSLARGGEVGLANSYYWFVDDAVGTVVSSYLTPLFYRCDNMLAGSNPQRIAYPQGCVFPQYTPIMTSMRGLPHIAANIRRIQSGGGHYGRYGSEHPLHHITDQAQQRRNRAVLCPDSRPRPRGMQCDEYPFASTKEGGNGVPPDSRGWAWVPAGEQQSQGGRFTTFYNANRVLDEDAFWVSV